jgi:5-methylcytosine-specific restriction endonuclease McrA
VVDEKLPVSRWEEFGYSSAREAAEDWNNLQAAHYICNLRKQNKTMQELGRNSQKNYSAEIGLHWLPDGQW